MAKHVQRALVASLFLFLVSGSIGVALADPISNYSEGWNVSGNLAGWGQNTIATTLSVSDEGGNPGGYLVSSGNATNGYDAIGANNTHSELTGDFSTLGGTWQLSFDLLNSSGTFGDAWVRFRYRDSSYNGWHYSLGNDFNAGAWTSYNIFFDQSWSDSEAVAAGWSHEAISPDWATTMSDVYSTEIRLIGSGSLEAGIDNFALTSVSAPVPEPSTILLLGGGLLGLGLYGRKRKKA